MLDCRLRVGYGTLKHKSTGTWKQGNAYCFTAVRPSVRLSVCLSVRLKPLACGVVIVCTGVVNGLHYYNVGVAEKQNKTKQNCVKDEHWSFSVSGPTDWNALPDYLRNPTLSTDVFKRYLKTFLFAQY